MDKVQNKESINSHILFNIALTECFSYCVVIYKNIALLTNNF
jgi:hypothetical protein